MEKSHNKFPDSLKLSNTVPAHKKKDPTDKRNYRPVTILPLSLWKSNTHKIKWLRGKFFESATLWFS